jgi:carboxyl-terminal processing protease
MNLAARLVPLFALLAAPFCVPAQVQALAKDGSSAYDQFREAHRLIRERYVMPLDNFKVMDGDIKGLVKGLDPHSEYLDAQDFRTLQEEALGQFGGLGVQVAMEQGSLKIVRAIPQSRAAKSGLRPGDIILRLNDQPITGLPISQAVARMRCPVDSMVRIAIRRKDQLAPIEMLVARFPGREPRRSWLAKGLQEPHQGRPGTEDPGRDRRGEDFHLRALPEPYVNLSIHTAPIVRPLP